MVDERQRHREVLAINRAIASAEDYDEVLRRVVDRTAAFTGATACLLLLAGEDGIARVARSVGIDAAKAAGLHVPLTERINGDLRELLGFQPEDGFTGVPVMGKSGLLGILAVLRQGPRAPDLGHDDELISAFADQAAIALDNAERIRQVRDEEALRQSEQRLRALADSMPQLAWTALPDGWMNWYNRRWYEYTGTTHEDVVGWGWERVHDPAALPEVLRRWRESIASGAPFEMEFPLRGAGGTFRRFLTRGFPLKDEAGHVLQWFGTHTDVTELVAAREEFAEADQRKTAFLAVLSHELRNPLAPIRNSVVLLERAPPGSEVARRALEVLRRQAEQLTRLVDDLLDVSRIAHGKLDLKLARLDARGVVRRVYADSKVLFEQREVELLLSEPAEPLWIEADDTRLSQLLGNLLHNALKFTPPLGQVYVKVARHDEACEVVVRDTGPGLAPGDLDRIFEPFVQSAGKRRDHGGLGIGLALVRDLARKHGGSVRAASAGLGKGAEFVVRLPLAPAPQPAASLRPVAAGEGDLAVLIVEDNDDAAATLADLLELTGNRVRTVGTGEAGVQAVAAARPDVLICDVGLPDMSGHDVIRTIRGAGEERGRDVFAVALTGYAQPKDREAALAAGFDAHLAKPPALDQLEALLALAARRRAQDGKGKWQPGDCRTPI